MGVYVILVVFSWLFLDLYTKTRRKITESGEVCYLKKNSIISNCFLILFFALNTCVLGFRYNIGIDYSVYNGIFQALLYERSTVVSYEIGFSFIVKLVGFFCKDSTVVFFVFAFLTTFFLTIAIKNTKKPKELYYFYFALGYFFNSMNIVRQSLALAIVLFSFHYIRKNKFIPYAVSILIASTVHTSAVFLLPAFFLNRRIFKPITYLLLGVPIFLVFYFGREYINRLIALTGYRNYLQGTGGLSSIGLYFLFEVLFFAVCIWQWNAITKNGNKQFILTTHEEPISVEHRNAGITFLFNVEFLRIIITSVTSYVPWAFRFAYYFDIFKVFLVVVLLNSIENPRIKFIMRITVPILYIVYIYIYNIVWGNNAIYPYVSIFDRGW